MNTVLVLEISIYKMDLDFWIILEDYAPAL